MNVIFHALAGGAIAHVAFVVEGRRSSPSFGTLSCVGLVAVAAHGVLDWLRHGYPIPSRVDVVAALVVSCFWLVVIRPQLRPLLVVALVGSFLPDVIDHVPRLLHVTAPVQGPIFPWHSPTWSGSLYPSAHIRSGSQLVALEDGNNAVVSALNHTFVVVVALCGIYLGRSAFRREPT